MSERINKIYVGMWYGIGWGLGWLQKAYRTARTSLRVGIADGARMKGAA